MISETMHNLFVVFIIFVVMESDIRNTREGWDHICWTTWGRVTKPQSNEALIAVQGSPCHFPTEVKIELTFQICATFVTI